MLKSAADDLRSLDVGPRNGRGARSQIAHNDENVPATMPWMKEGHKSLPTRTSASHPITVSWIDGGAQVGLCYCPGKNVVREVGQYATLLKKSPK